MDQIELRANGLQFAALRHGSGDRRALLLHGFPDNPGSMKPLMRRLGEAGYTTVAPWMRGYHPTEIPSDDNYHASALGDDAIGLIDALGWQRPLVVGHDWGAVAAYAACSLAPERVLRLVALSVPPPSVFLRNTLRHPAQIKRSWYMAFFQIPYLAESYLRSDDFAVLEGIWRPILEEASEASEEHLERVKRTLGAPGSLSAALGYYRALLPGRGPLEAYRRSRQLTQTPISRPTLMITGAEDAAIGPETFEDPGSAFEAPWEMEVLDGVGHFVQLEAVKAVSELVSK